MIRNLFAPLRRYASWDGQRVQYRCDTCGLRVPADHRPGGMTCRENIIERTAKHGQS